MYILTALLAYTLSNLFIFFQVATAVQADWLFLLTDVDALYTTNPINDPNAQPIHVVHDISQLEVQSSPPPLHPHIPCWTPHVDNYYLPSVKSFFSSPTHLNASQSVKCEL